MRHLKTYNQHSDFSIEELMRYFNLTTEYYFYKTTYDDYIYCHKKNNEVRIIKHWSIKKFNYNDLIISCEEIISDDEYSISTRILANIIYKLLEKIQGIDDLESYNDSLELGLL